MFLMLFSVWKRTKKKVRAYTQRSEAQPCSSQTNLDEVTLYKCEKLTRKANVIEANYKLLFGFFFSFSLARFPFGLWPLFTVIRVNGAVFITSMRLSEFWIRKKINIQIDFE